MKPAKPFSDARRSDRELAACALERQGRLSPGTEARWLGSSRHLPLCSNATVTYPWRLDRRETLDHRYGQVNAHVGARRMTIDRPPNDVQPRSSCRRARKTCPPAEPDQASAAGLSVRREDRIEKTCRTGSVNSPRTSQWETRNDRIEASWDLGRRYDHHERSGRSGQASVFPRNARCGLNRRGCRRPAADAGQRRRGGQAVGAALSGQSVHRGAFQGPVSKHWVGASYSRTGNSMRPGRLAAVDIKCKQERRP